MAPQVKDAGRDFMKAAREQYVGRVRPDDGADMNQAKLSSAIGITAQQSVVFPCESTIVWLLPSRD